MTIDTIAPDDGVSRELEESPFSRDLDGFLIRIDPVTDLDYDRLAKITIDGQEIAVRVATPSTDAQGNLLYRDGKTIPRAATIYDAAQRLPSNPIPILCHQVHQTPAGVCRVCSVYVTRPNDRYPPRKLFPACQHRVEDGMAIHTQASTVPMGAGKKTFGESVRGVVRMLTELLVADALPASTALPAPDNELARLAQRFGVTQSRFPGRTPLRAGAPSIDASSPLVLVDHAQCILCDRCIRGCDDVRKNFIIGRTGKGYGTRIGFDLDQPMGDSGCVECGECLISCPTGALTTTKRILQSPREGPREGPGEVLGPVAVDELLRPPLDRLFGALPRKFLEWNFGAVARRKLKPRDLLYKEAQYGSHAFLLEKGILQMRVDAPQFGLKNERSTSWFARLRGHSVLRKMSAAGAGANAPNVPRRVRTDLSGFSLTTDELVSQIASPIDGPNMQLLGVSACLNNYPYANTLQAVTAATVLEIRRNVLLQMMRNPATRTYLNEVYRDEALLPYLLRMPLLSPLAEEERRRLSERLAAASRFVRVDPGQPIYEQGDMPDHCSIVRIGFVRVSQKRSGQEIVLDYVGPDGLVGDEELLETIAGRPARRGSSCRALDHVELLQIPRETLEQLVGESPELRARLTEAADRRKREYEEETTRADRPLGDYLDRGLFNARSLLVLDLDKCTRCDECTKACADTHGGITRLIREGLRFDKFLVATSCRSCLDPTCLIGCPVDAIHRSKEREIRIEPYCIGCGLCAESCPYGNIQMAEVPDQTRKKAIKATTCDLCRDLVGDRGETSCVHACPHDAAHRINGQELFKLVSSPPPEASR